MKADSLPFQVEITDKVKQKDNFLVVKVNNTRTTDAIPAMSFDWWNYGGITRDVMLVSVPQSYIKDHFIQLDKVQSNLIRAKVTLSEAKPGINVQVAIPELGIRQNMTTDANGIARATIKTKKLQRWSPDAPKLYDVTITSESDRLNEQIGFRNLYVKGEDIYLNDRAHLPAQCQLPRGNSATPRACLLRSGRNNAVVRSQKSWVPT